MSQLIRIVIDDGNERVEMLCPKCEEFQDILAFKVLETSGKYGKSLNPIIKCGKCRHLFSPRWLATD